MIFSIMLRWVRMVAIALGYPLSKAIYKALPLPTNVMAMRHDGNWMGCLLFGSRCFGFGTARHCYISHINFHHNGSLRIKAAIISSIKSKPLSAENYEVLRSKSHVWVREVKRIRFYNNQRGPVIMTCYLKSGSRIWLAHNIIYSS